MARAPDFAKHLDADEWNQLEAFARDPGRTIKDVFTWITAKGIKTSESAVQRWKSKFDETDGYAAAADFADAIYTAQSDAGGVDLTKAAMLQLSQRLVNKLAQGIDPADTKGMYTLARMLESLTRSGRHNVKLEEELKELKRKNDAAIRTAEAAAASGAKAVDVVSEIKRALGVTA